VHGGTRVYEKIKHTDREVNCTHRAWSGEPGRVARLHNPTLNHHMEQCLPLSVPVAGTFLHVPCSSRCRASTVSHSMCQRAVGGVSDRHGCRVSGCRCGRERSVSSVAESPARGCSLWARRGGGGDGRKRRVRDEGWEGIGSPARLHRECFFLGGRRCRRRRRKRGCGQVSMGAAKLSLPALPH